MDEIGGEELPLAGEPAFNFRQGQEEAAVYLPPVELQRCVCGGFVKNHVLPAQLRARSEQRQPEQGWGNTKLFKELPLRTTVAGLANTHVPCSRGIVTQRVPVLFLAAPLNEKISLPVESSATPAAETCTESPNRHSLHQFLIPWNWCR